MIKRMDINKQDVCHFVEKAIDFHCHGVGKFDFTEISEIDLDEIESILLERKQQTILTLYLPKKNFEHFLRLLEIFQHGKKTGRYKRILGFGLEGPLLASHGGTPEIGVWLPSKAHWREIAACGKNGLKYVILSPDAALSEHLRENGWHQAPQDMVWIAETLLENGVLPAPGHFTKENPYESAQYLQTLFDVVSAWGKGAIITDHLYNDMPRNFKHAWRTPLEKKNRDHELESLNLSSWTLHNLEEKLGIVPAVMIRNAHKGFVKICQNFDGEHVDLAIVKKTVQLVGAENLLMMTDSIESKRLAGRHLYSIEQSSLLFQEKGVVAAGSKTVFDQIINMFKIELTVNEIELITQKVPHHILNQIRETVYDQVDCV